MDLRRTLEINRSTGWWGLRNRSGFLGEFHRRRKLAPGKWKYMGHLIIKNPRSKVWRATPDVLYICDEEIFRHHSQDKIMRRKTMSGITWAMFNQYLALAQMVIEIEDERRKDTR